MKPGEPIEIMRGPKLDRSLREMWYTYRAGRKVRIGARIARRMLDAGTAVEVDPTTLAVIFRNERTVR